MPLFSIDNTSIKEADCTECTVHSFTQFLGWVVNYIKLQSFFLSVTTNRKVLLFALITPARINLLIYIGLAQKKNTHKKSFSKIAKTGKQNVLHNEMRDSLPVFLHLQCFEKLFEMSHS